MPSVSSTKVPTPSGKSKEVRICGRCVQTNQSLTSFSMKSCKSLLTSILNDPPSTFYYYRLVSDRNLKLLCRIQIWSLWRSSSSASVARLWLRSKKCSIRSRWTIPHKSSTWMSWVALLWMLNCRVRMRRRGSRLMAWRWTSSLCAIKISVLIRYYKIKLRSSQTLDSKANLWSVWLTHDCPCKISRASPSLSDPRKRGESGICSLHLLNVYSPKSQARAIKLTSPFSRTLTSPHATIDHACWTRSTSILLTSKSSQSSQTLKSLKDSGAVQFNSWRALCIRMPAFSSSS